VHTVGTVIYGSLSIGASYAFLYWGLLKIPASLTMIILSVGPLLTMVFATAHRLERFRWSGLVGALTALAGIILAVGGELGSSIPLFSLLAVLAGAACIAEASVLYKLFPKSDPLATNAIGTTTGSILLILVSWLQEKPGSCKLPGHMGCLCIPGFDGFGRPFLPVPVRAHPMDRNRNLRISAVSSGNYHHRGVAFGRGHYTQVSCRRVGGPPRCLAGCNPRDSPGFC
jgi:uncharacterized membrane protein YdcZ (DUF606 family)